MRKERRDIEKRDRERRGRKGRKADAFFYFLISDRFIRGSLGLHDYVEWTRITSLLSERERYRIIALIKLL